MSLVQALMCEDYVLVCAEMKAKLDDGRILEDFKKIYKLNDDVIIAFTGTIEDNRYLFQEYVTSDLSMKDKITDSLDQVFKAVDLRFKELQTEEYTKILNKKACVHSVICGWNGNRLIGRTYFLGGKDHQGITEFYPDVDQPYKLVSCGEGIHFDYLCQKINSHIQEYGKSPNIRQGKNIFQDVLDHGITVDDTINNVAIFEQIRRSDKL